ncbi:MAG: DUF3375 domain-containing protein [Rhodanobacter sp.]
MDTLSLDYATLDLLRTRHPGWRLLRSEHAPLVAGFLQRVFIAPNVRVIAQSDLAEALEDELFGLREHLGAEAFPRPALEYLNDWAGAEKSWLRKFYRHGSDEPQFDLAPSTEKTIAWLATLSERSFVGTESRLLTLFALLRQLGEGTETDADVRMADLRRRRAEIDAQIATVEAGQLTMLDDTAVRDRFQQFQQLARELLTDFREVEQNFRQLDRRVRERIALWQGGKGALLQEIIGERDAIADSDQGRSFHAFWDFLMSSARQEELSMLLDRTLALPAVSTMRPEPRLRRVHYDWLEAGEHTQRTVAELSGQLRRFLDDQAWLENRRIMDILHAIESHALALRDAAPAAGTFMSIDDSAATVELPMERPLHTPVQRPQIVDVALDTGDADLDAAALYAQTVVDKTQLSRHIDRALRERTQITLVELLGQHPLQQGLAELVVYLQLAVDRYRAVVDESVRERVPWTYLDAQGHAHERYAQLPRIIFVRAV